ncbi:MAG: DUF4136 domain-containing protein [Rubrivivax sp.]|nr:DUF4136 domain-containing protein [Rubrivivax sp.]
MNRRQLCAAFVTAVLGGCATITSVTSDVSSFGEWPTGRQPGSYAFERLPSQQANAAEAQALETAAAKALQKAGFVPAASAAEPDVLVQLGARFTRTLRSPWDDPLWWRGGFGRFRHGPWIGPSWSLAWQAEATRYESEVAVLLRDRASGKPLYETRAALESNLSADAAVVGALFEAALVDFPRPAISPRRVTVQVAP